MRTETGVLSLNPQSDDIVGIDLGGTNSRVSVFEEMGPKVIHNLEGKQSMPCFVARSVEGKLLVGTLAKSQASTNATKTIHGFKVLLGRSFDDYMVENVRSLDIGYNIVEGDNGDAFVEWDDEKHTPSLIAAYIITQMKLAATTHLGKPLSKAVITVPAYFGEPERRAMKDAASLAGLKDYVKILSEPIAAVLSYGLNNKERIIAVYDYGGSTFNVSIVQISKWGCKVIATRSHLNMGGQDFSNALFVYLFSEFQKFNELSEDLVDLGGLSEATENAKIELSYKTETCIKMPLLSGAKHVSVTVTRSKFEKMVNRRIEITRVLCRQCLKDAGISVRNIDEVLLVGGSTRMPRVQKVVHEIFGKSPAKGVNPEEAVARGAAIQIGILCGAVKEPVLHGTKDQVSTASFRPVDWRKCGAVTTPMNQGRCGSCWACAAMATVESRAFLKSQTFFRKGILQNLSVQQLVDCAVKEGCKGGSAYDAFEFIMANGIATAVDYPYTGKADQPCDKSHPIAVTIKGYEKVPLGNHNILKALSRQPLMASLSHLFVSSTEYTQYTGGIIYGDERLYEFSEKNEGHSVCLVGWDREDGVPYFIVKDSKGPNWGEGGYFKLAITSEWIKGVGDVNEIVCFPTL